MAIPARSLPPRPSRFNAPVIVVLVFLLVASAITGATAWYLLLTPPNADARPPVTNIALENPTSRTSRPADVRTAVIAAEAVPVSMAVAALPSAAPSAPPSSSLPSEPPSSSTAPGEPTVAPSASVDPQVVAQIDAVVATVPDVRQLQPKTTVPYRFITRDEFAVEAQQQFTSDNPPDRVAAESDLDKRLGLLAPDADLGKDEVDLLASQVAAFYDPKTKAFTVIEEPGHTFAADDKVTVAHEYDHALQDQYFDLNKLQDIPADESDRQLALTALAEGDATDVMYEWAFTHLSPEEIATLGSSATPEDQQALDAAPMLLRQSLTFPYLTGLAFITAIQSNGGWDAVNDVWRNPPLSTEQIMHPEKYAAGEAPIDVQLPKLAGKLGDGWHEAIDEIEGEFFTGVWVANGDEGSDSLLGLPGPLPNADAAAGWGGDRIASYDGPNGAWAVVWQTAWDTAADATQFVAAANPVLAGLTAASATATTSAAGQIANPVLVLIASDADALDHVSAAVGLPKP